MKKEFTQFMDMVKNDELLQKKLEEAGRSYTGAQSETEVFEQIVAPIAKNAGYDFTLEDMKQSLQELSLDEMSQVAGGWGFGAGACKDAGLGISFADSENGGAFCLVIGSGDGAVACAGEGVGAGRSTKEENQED